MVIRIKPIVFDVVGWALFFISLILWLFLSHTLIPGVVFFMAAVSFSIVIIWRFRKSGKK